MIKALKQIISTLEDRWCGVVVMVIQVVNGWFLI
jgi:hypothetical protein